MSKRDKQKRPQPATSPSSGSAPANATASSGLKVRVVIHPADGGGFWAQVPALPGCMTQGETREQLLVNLREAIQGVLLSTHEMFQAEEGGQEEEVEL